MKPIAHTLAMEREVRYCRTEDGVRIAYVDVGKGPPFVSLTWLRPVTGTADGTAGEGLEAISRAGFRYISFDLRGMGASQRDVPEISLDTQLRDLEAVVAHAGIGRFILHATRPVSQPAIAYAAMHPEQIARLIMMSPYASGTEFFARWRFSATLSALRASGDMVTYAAIFASLHEMTATSALEWIKPSMVAAYEDASRRTDVSDLLARVEAPTLVIHASTFDLRSLSRDIAAGIRDARLVSISGHDAGEQARVIAEFLQSTRRGQLDPTARTAGPFRTILFTDIVGHTEMMQRLGDAKGRNVLREHERITREMLMKHGGAEVKTMGDGFMASFDSVTKAMDCAIALQQAFAAHSELMPEPLHVRVGLNAGEPIEEDGDLFGSTVILASRICAKADAGEILIPEPLRHLLTGKSYVYADRGEMMLKASKTPSVSAKCAGATRKRTSCACLWNHSGGLAC